MNNGKYNTPEYKQKQDAKIDRLYGPVTKHVKVCQCCNKEFIFEGRLKTKNLKKQNFVLEVVQIIDSNGGRVTLLIIGQLLFIIMIKNVQYADLIKLLLFII